MLLQPKGNTNVREQFHVPSGIGKALILTGVVEEVLPPPKTTLPRKWVALVGAMEGQYPPIVRFSCPNCGQSGYTESKRGTAHKSAQFFHCGTVETCPDAVVEHYVALWKQYMAQFDRKRRR